MSDDKRVLEYEGGDTIEEAERRAAIIKEEMRKLGIKGKVTIDRIDDSADNPGAEARPADASPPPDFASKRLSAAEWPLLMQAYAETYPVRPLLNHVIELAAALKRAHEAMESVTIFVQSREHINRPTGEEWWHAERRAVCDALATVDGGGEQ